ncbi:MAG TPA: DUF3138 family protein [Anaeromyxobacter sp.]|nr:DUF3138 family protein [Anaeromyxobacter sp.]
MRILTLSISALALAGAFPARAANPDPETAKELKALQDRVTELEKQVQALPPPGMTPEQQQDFGRIQVKAESLEDGRDASGLKGFKVSGWMDPTYVYNANKERGTFQFLVPTTAEGYSYDDSYFGTVALDIIKETENGTRFHLDLIPKRGTGDFNNGSIVNEASVWIPLGGLSTKLIAGQVPDWSGYEYQAPNQNLLVTHNLLFDFTIPYYYTGFGIERVTPRIDLKVMVANFNQSIRQLGEHIPALVFRGDYTPKGTDYWGFGFAGALGYKDNARAFVDSGYGTNSNGVALEADGVTPVSSKDTFYFTGEVDGWYTRGDVTLNGHLTYGRQRGAAITADPDGRLRDAWWWGASVLGAYKITTVLQGVVRADFIYDVANGGGLLDWVSSDTANGVGPDQNGGNPDRGANKYALTLGLNYSLSANVTLKAEYRLDGATENVFGNKDALAGGSNPQYRKFNSLASAQVVFFF